MSEPSESELEQLRSRLYPFALEWTRRTSRRLVTLRDGIDFLAAMKARDDFWAAFARPRPGASSTFDLVALRAAAPARALDPDLTPEEYLRSVGMTDDEVRSVVTGLDQSESFDDAIRIAFAAGRPQSVARALERILEIDGDVLATQSYVRRLAAGSGVARAFSAMIGIALLLVGAACGPGETAPIPAEETATTTAPTVESAPEPTIEPTPEPAAADPAPQPEPEEEVQPAGEADPEGEADSESDVDSEPPVGEEPAARPRRPRSVSVPLYKGVTPRRRRPRTS